MAWKLRRESPEHKLMDDFVGLGLIGVVYGLSVVLGAWGFFAAFFAAVSLRQTELKLSGAGRETSVKPLMGLFWRHRRSLPAP